MITSGEEAGLAYDLALPDGAADSGVAAVLLHGRGSHKGDLQALGPVLPPDWAIVTPQAPYPAADWGYGPGWAWYRYLSEDKVDRDTLDRSLGLLDDFLDELPDVLGHAPKSVVLGGFSQGGTTSLAYALTRDRALAAVWNLSGFLEASLDVPHWRERTVPPIYWGHGVRDANIPIGLAHRGRARLEEAGLTLVAGDYEIGHWIVPEEIHEALTLVPRG